MSRSHDSDPRDLEAEGLLPIEDPLPGVDDVTEGMVPPRDHPQPIGDEVTAAGQRNPESLRERVRREEPDRLRPEPDEVGRLVQPDQGVVDVDEEPEEIADAVFGDRNALSAEEQALHITDNP
jgi:hypothetical protein